MVPQPGVNSPRGEFIFLIREAAMLYVEGAGGGGAGGRTQYAPVVFSPIEQSVTTPPITWRTCGLLILVLKHLRI
ncbi:hypothetical protein SLEP1_g40807 [Rubroshorea leprosula]|uniref:Uncharacterized protein n=1 Tax=Rubroshorea leprosula TaxID=152421 RepID=A0AAV5L4K4_9ROSI|nr:hypothetical protein SLEP1_g40807 [Rubroshorea leprosula]